VALFVLTAAFCLPGGAVLWEIVEKRWYLALPFSVRLILIGASTAVCTMCVRSHFVIARAFGWAMAFVGYAAMANVLALDRAIARQIDWLFYAGVAGASVGVVGSPAWKLSPSPGRRSGPSETSAGASQGPAHRRAQFSMRTLLVTVAAVGIILSFFGRPAERYLRHHRATVAVRGLGGSKMFCNSPRQLYLLAWLADLLGCASRVDLVLVRPEGAVGDDELLGLDSEFLASVERLDLTSTQVGDVGLACLKRAEQLRFLSLGERTTDAGLVHLVHLNRLYALELDDTHVTGNGLTYAKDLPSLRSLSLQRSAVVDAGLTHLRGMKGLRYLNVADTGIGDSGLSNLRDLPELQNLNLSNTQVSDAGLARMGDLPELYALHLHGTKITDAGLTHLRRFGRLSSLGLERTQVTGSGLTQLGNTVPLHRLSLESSPVNDATVVGLRGLAGLKSLNLNGTNLRGAGLAVLADLPNLESLQVESTPVNDAALAHLKSCPKLRRLNLSGTQVTDAGVPCLAGLSALMYLDLSATKITDATLGPLENLPNLRILEVGGTQVTPAGMDAYRTARPDVEIR
jgi:Leucine-rich repeat (LRR) protein